MQKKKHTVHEKCPTVKKQLRRQNNTPSGKLDSLPGFPEKYNVNSPTTDTSIRENKMTPHKCQVSQANPLLCEHSHKMKRERPFSLVWLEWLDSTVTESYL